MRNVKNKNSEEDDAELLTTGIVITLMAIVIACLLFSMFALHCFDLILEYAETIR